MGIEYAGRVSGDKIAVGEKCFTTEGSRCLFFVSKYGGLPDSDCLQPECPVLKQNLK